MLIVRGERAVLCNDRPVIGKLLDLGASYVNHRLDCDYHAAAESCSTSCCAEVRNVGVFVEVFSDSVADVFLNGRESVRNDITVHSGSYIAYTRAFFAGSLCSEFPASLCDRDELLCFFGDVSAGEGVRAVSVEAVYVRAYIYLNDIPFFDDSVR